MHWFALLLLLTSISQANTDIVLAPSNEIAERFNREDLHAAIKTEKLKLDEMNVWLESGQKTTINNEPVFVFSVSTIPFTGVAGTYFFSKSRSLSKKRHLNDLILDGNYEKKSEADSLFRDLQRKHEDLFYERNEFLSELERNINQIEQLIQRKKEKLPTLPEVVEYKKYIENSSVDDILNVVRQDNNRGSISTSAKEFELFQNKTRAENTILREIETLKELLFQKRQMVFSKQAEYDAIHSELQGVNSLLKNLESEIPTRKNKRRFLEREVRQYLAASVLSGITLMATIGLASYNVNTIVLTEDEKIDLENKIKEKQHTLQTLEDQLKISSSEQSNE
ncbi:MAG: hypothetical protein AB7F43_10970 [Bacteriovoracia bacterium]